MIGVPVSNYELSSETLPDKDGIAAFLKMTAAVGR